MLTSYNFIIELLVLEIVLKVSKLVDIATSKFSGNLQFSNVYSTARIYD